VLGFAPEQRFDAVLLDAPCSATGTFRRHPEVLLRASERIIRESAELQGRLLTAAAEWVRPGGTLVYAVCSLEPEEGEEIVAAFLGQRTDYAMAEQRRILPGELEEQGGMDGFFTARLVRGA
jgi:16S rRNA (cytosine967-C5)-methyltransferase